MNAHVEFPGRTSAMHHPVPDQSLAILRRTALPVHDARRLTGAGGLAQIVLDDQVYALRITRAGKLILTK